MNFILKKIKPSMYRNLYEWRMDADALRHNPFAPWDFEEFSSKMDGYSSDLNEIYGRKDFKWVITEQDKILAMVGLTDVNAMMKIAEINYQVNPKFRKQGIGSCAVHSLVSMVFDQTDLRKLTAIISDTNIPSCKIVEKIGFTQEGLLRKHFIIEGREVDERLYGIFKKELRNLQ